MKSLADYLSAYPQLSTVLAVSKTHSVEAIEQLNKLGFMDFGENKAQELKQKASLHPEYRWHFIGQIQSNKIKDIAKYAHTIQSLSSLKQIQLFEKEALKLNKQLQVYLQVNLSHEAQKSGCEESEVNSLCEALRDSKQLKLMGLMVMGPSSADPLETAKVFKKAQLLLKETQIKYPECKELSMGMSQDYLLALEYGSTLIRLGTLLFGRRL